MTLQGLLYLLQLRHDLLINEDEIWWSSRGPDRRMVRALKRHKRGLRQLLSWSSIDACPARDLHRRYWKYGGDGRYICEYCQNWQEEYERVA